MMQIQRRTLFRSLLGAGAFASVAPAMNLFADTPEDFRFVSLYLNGGWDVLLGLDARDPGNDYDGLDHGTGLLAPEYRDPISVTIGSKAVLWGASTLPLTLGGAARHSDLCTLFRSVNMNTVAHAAGRAYVNTFRAPTGVVPRGSSLGTVMSTAGALDAGLVLPNVSIGLPSFNEVYGPEYTGVRTARAPDITDLLQASEGSRFDDATERLLASTQDAMETCVSERYSRRRPHDDLAESRGRVRRLLDEDIGALFDVTGDSTQAVDLRDRYGLSAANARNTRHPSTVAAIVGQLFSTGLTRSVSATLQLGLDTHNETWGTTQPVRQADAFTALSHLLTDLRRDDPGLARTVVVVHSEFARTPKINGNSGRDHWFANSMAVFSGLLESGVVGETSEESLGLQKTDLVTGDASTSGEMLRPEMIAATLAKAVGLDTNSFRAPVLDAWIKETA